MLRTNRLGHLVLDSIGMERHNFKITIYKGIDKMPIKTTTIAKVLNHLQTGCTKQTAQLCYHRWHNPTRYEALKADLYGFASGEWSERAEAGLITYSPLMVFDLDGGEDYRNLNDLRRDWEMFREIPEVMFLYPSPSCAGLRIGILTDATYETHRMCYLQCLKMLSEHSNIEINGNKAKKHFDSSCSNPSRFFYFAPMKPAWVHVNWESEIFKTEITNPQPEQTHQNNSQYDIVDSDTLMGVCLEIIVKKDIQFYVGYRKKFCYRVAKIMCEAGLSEHRILNYLAQYEQMGRDGLSLHEIGRQIRYAIQKTNKYYNLNQLKSYLLKI